MADTESSLNKLRLLLFYVNDHVEQAKLFECSSGCSAQSVKLRTAIADLYNDVAGAHEKLVKMAEFGKAEGNFEEFLEDVSELERGIREDVFLIDLKSKILDTRKPVYFPQGAPTRTNETSACKIATRSDALDFVISTANDLGRVGKRIVAMLEHQKEMDEEARKAAQMSFMDYLRQIFRSPWYSRWIVYAIVAFVMYFFSDRSRNS